MKAGVRRFSLLSDGILSKGITGRGLARVGKGSDICRQTSYRRVVRFCFLPHFLTLMRVEGIFGRISCLIFPARAS
jgi:hypothetical protein